jgi:hypothetical protein
VRYHNTCFCVSGVAGEFNLHYGFAWKFRGALGYGNCAHSYRHTPSVKPIKKLVSVSHLVDEALSLALSGSNVRKLVDIPECIHAVEVDAGQIHQAFNNILINAVQAMPEGGTVAIKAENVSLDECNGFGLAPGSRRRRMPYGGR